MILVQLTDLHLRADRRAPRHEVLGALTSAVDVINRMKPQPDAVLFTGDLIERSTHDYSPVLAALRALRVPLLPLPGNHDDTAAFRAAFARDAEYAAGHLSFARPLCGGMLIGLDSNAADGTALLDTRRLDWLAGMLKRADAPTVVALHHPPFATGIPRADAAPFPGAAALKELIARSPCVVRLLAGHTHRNISTLWAGVQASTAPPLGHALALSLLPDGGHAHSAEAPALQIHLIEGRTCITHTLSLSPRDPVEGMTTALSPAQRAMFIAP